MSQPSFVAVDWGTTDFRLWVMDDGGQILNNTQGPFGMSRLKPDDFGRVLEESLNKLGVDEEVPVVICGMAGAAQGWYEAPYLTAPTQLETLVQQALVVPKTRRCIRILPGVKQMNPADVMRGEETQIAGYLAKDPNFFGTLCLPGTHSKWTQISAEEIVSFRTFMTGELFALLSTQSVLRHALDTSEWSEDDYLEALNDAMSAPQQLSARLFALRADGLLHGLSPTAVRSRLSGYLIGLELAGAKPYWLGLDVVVIGDPKLTPLYTRALKAQGVSCLSQNGDEMTQAGLKAAYRVLKEG